MNSSTGGDASGNPMEAILKMAQNMKPPTGGARRTRKAGGIPAVGTKAQVFHGTAKHTSGGLTRKDLVKTKKGRIVSRKKHAAGKRALSRLRKAGFVAKKGTFKLFKRG